MTTHLLRDLERVKREVLAMGGAVEEATGLAISAVIERRPQLAARVMEGDDAIDARELALEDECLKLLALHQPVAGDLRFIVSIMKVNNDLERVGDLALNVAERAMDLVGHPELPGMQGIRVMGERVRSMLRESLDALVNQDAALARKVCDDDAEVDELHRRRYTDLPDLMRSDPSLVAPAIGLLSVSRYLERIADHATNIAEDVVFMVEGEVIRHQRPSGPADHS